MKAFIFTLILIISSACGKQSKTNAELSSNEDKPAVIETQKTETITNKDPNPEAIESKLGELKLIYKCSLIDMTCDKENFDYYEIESLLTLQNKLYKEILTKLDQDYYQFGQYNWDDTLTAYLVKSIMETKSALAQRTKRHEETFLKKQKILVKKLNEKTPLKNVSKITYMQVGFPSEYAAIDSALKWLASSDEHIDMIQDTQVLQSFEDITLINISNLALLADQYDDRITLYYQFDIESNLEIINLKNQVRKKVKEKIDTELSIDSYITLNWNLTRVKTKIIDFNSYRDDIFQIQSNSFINKVMAAVKSNAHIRDFKIALNKQTQQSEKNQIAEGSLYLRISY